MATPVHPQPAPSVSNILDQLDELEALMQRMLALPVNPAEGETAARRSRGPSGRGGPGTRGAPPGAGPPPDPAEEASRPPEAPSATARVLERIEALRSSVRQESAARNEEREEVPRPRAEPSYRSTSAEPAV